MNGFDNIRAYRESVGCDSRALTDAICYMRKSKRRRIGLNAVYVSHVFCNLADFGF